MDEHYIGRKQILESLDCLSSALQLMRNGLPANLDRMSFLADCQQLTIGLGEAVETSKSFGKIVPYLEAYCEEIYNLSQCALGDCVEQEYIAACEKIIADMIETVKAIPYKIFILPYQFAMWDSLETIYLAAKQKENVEVYVVPLPYFERDSEGKLNVMKCEYEQFCSKPDVLYWENVSLAEERPDVIFIHNPFDGANYVSSIHPKFYSTELKKVTECLVFVPYYLTIGEVSESHELLPAYKTCDYIIAQNREVVKQLGKHVAKEKILPLGSPKLDRLLLADTDELPQDVVDKCKGKKVVFLNTSISFILEDANRLNTVLMILQSAESIENAVFIWRPHPLLESTLKAMRPEFVPEYQKLCEYAKNSTNVILDHGMDLHAVLAMSDAYIGEKKSSVVTLFAAQGKPLYFLEEVSNAQSTLLTRDGACFTSVCSDEQYLYFVHLYYPWLCKADLTSGKIEKIYKLPVSNSYSCREIGELMLVDHMVVMAPYSANRIFLFDTENETVTGIDVKKTQCWNYNQIVDGGDKVFLIPILNEHLVTIDKSNKTVDFSKGLTGAVRKRMPEAGFYSFNGAYCDGETLYLASPRGNRLICYVVKSGAVQSLDIPSGNEGYWNLCADGKTLWLNPNKGKAIVEFILETGEWREFTDYPEGFDMTLDSSLFISLVDCDTYLLAFPKTANMIVKIDKVTGIMEEVKTCGERDKKASLSWGSAFYFAKRIGKKVFAQRSSDNTLLIYDIEKGIFDTLEISYDDEQIHTIVDDLSFFKADEKYYNAYTGSFDDGIQTFISKLVKEELSIDTAKRNLVLSMFANNDGTAGEKITEYIIGKIK